MIELDPDDKNAIDDALLAARSVLDDEQFTALNVLAQKFRNADAQQARAFQRAFVTIACIDIE